MMKVFLVENDINDSLMESALKKEGYDFIKIQYGPFFIPLVKEANPDIVIFNVDTPSEKIISDLHYVDQQLSLPIIFYSKDDRQETIKKVIHAGVTIYMVDGIDSQRLGNVMNIAFAMFTHQQELKTALEDARTQLEDRKKIDRAKAILIKTQKFSEDEAYHTLRKLAMDRNITLGEMARNVIAMAELLK